MEHNIYHIFPALELQSGLRIYLQSISLSHTYAGLLCGSPNEHINKDILLEIHEQYPEGLFVIEPKVTMVSENDFFGRSIPNHNNKNQIPLMPPVKVEALFECYDSESTTYLNIVWFQDDFSATMATPIERLIQKLDWNSEACEFSL
ncbi:MAG: hypothetical protein L0Y61_08660 [Epsilonproteobacteria bacterium]|nr:hypothetical protein [Campylobacterota bacterium]